MFSDNAARHCGLTNLDGVGGIKITAGKNPSADQGSTQPKYSDMEGPSVWRKVRQSREQPTFREHVVPPLTSHTLKERCPLTASSAWTEQLFRLPRLYCEEHKMGGSSGQCLVWSLGPPVLAWGERWSEKSWGPSASCSHWSLISVSAQTCQ